MRLIDADYVLEHKYDIFAGIDLYDFEHLIEIYNENAPTIDTEKHGLWKIEQENIVVPMYCFTCSVCGEMFCDEDKYIVASMHYCMNCGAKMDFFWKRGE